MSFRTIVVGVDLSPASLIAAHEASALLAPGGTLVLAHIIEHAIVTNSPRHQPPSDIERFLRQREVDARVGIEELAGRLSASRQLSSKIVIKVGQAVEDLIDIVEQEGAQLLAVGAHGQSKLELLVFGSVAEALTHRSPVPTLVARGRPEGTTVTRVLAALDVSIASVAAAHVAANVGRALDAPVVVLHAVGRPSGSDRLRREPASEAEPTSIKSFAEDAGLVTERIKIVVGLATQAIVGYATPSDIVVCGTRARGPIHRAVLGSVALSLVRRAPCSVIVVRAEHARSERPA